MFPGCAFIASGKLVKVKGLVFQVGSNVHRRGKDPIPLKPPMLLFLERVEIRNS